MHAPVGASCPLVAAVDADPGLGDSLLVDAEGATCIEDSSERHGRPENARHEEAGARSRVLIRPRRTRPVGYGRARLHGTQRSGDAGRGALQAWEFRRDGDA